MVVPYSTVASYGNPAVNTDGSIETKSALTNSSVAWVDPLTGVQTNTSADILMLILMEMRVQTQLLLEGLNIDPHNDPQAVRTDPTTNPVATANPVVYS